MELNPPVRTSHLFETGGETLREGFYPQMRLTTERPYRELRKEIFRDTRCGYLAGAWTPNRLILNYVRERAGKEILDVGCGIGLYSQLLDKWGFQCIATDRVQEYVRHANLSGINRAVMSGYALGIRDEGVDTVLLVEVLEHLDKPELLLREARRVARKNVIMTVPNNENFQSLARLRVTYEHVLDLDHTNFFTKRTLEDLLAEVFEDFFVERREPLILTTFLPRTFGRAIAAGVDLFFRNVVRLPWYYRLYAEAMA